MKKKILTLIIIVFAMFLISGCDKASVLENSGENNNTNNGNNGNNTSNEEIKLYSDDTKIVFNYMNIYYITYYHEKERITGLEYIYKCDNEATAKVTKSMLDNTYAEEDNVKSVVLKGKYIIITFTEEEYKDETLEEVKTTYSYLEQIYKNN